MSVNLPAVTSGTKDIAVGVATYADNLIDKAIPIPFEKPSNNSIVTRAGHAFMGAVYAFGALGSLAPFGMSLVGDAVVGGVGAAAARYGKENGEIANAGRLAMQTGIVASGASAASIVVGVASYVNAAAYGRACVKSFKAAWTGAGTPPPPQVSSTKSPW